MKTAKLKDILTDHGCTCLDRSAAKHEKWHSPITGNTFGVPRHRTVNINTARAILREAGINVKL